MKMNRRDALHHIVGISGVAVGASLLPNSVIAMETGYIIQPGEKLRYVPLDPMTVAKLAYNTGNGCMYQVFHSVIYSLGQSNSVDAEKFRTIPTALAAYGWAGVMGQGTICGNLNALAMLVNILDDVNGQQSALVDAMYRFFERETLPYSHKEFIDGIGSTDDKTLEVGQSSIANSITCHSSISNWSKASGKSFSQKKERCYRLSASVVHKLVELLNAAHNGADIAQLTGLTITEETAQCQTCHSTSKPLAPASSVKTNMECTTCHTGHFF
ncbi:cytochrome c3 family protein [Shewanella corallii]|uniref:Cytochrome c3 family protein n=1 Tax=Shewanella corallii TaxID=560080 RepID=A0ABT0N570_9GAMM|nr:C-GCAxxG-C-C family (seleno)protein [Shewanella corallii]MCL2913568.1 cytochrome c3 family protein [Shewanella corallii]